MAATGPARRSGRETRERIEKESMRLFAEKGFHGTSVKDIAAAVGVADAALYRHFKSKDEIAGTLFRTHYSALAREIARIGQTSAPFRDIVARLVELFCRLFDKNEDAFRFILMHQHDQLDLIPDEDNAVSRLREIMRRAIEADEIILRDPDLAAAVALGAVVQPGTFKLYGRLPGPLLDRAAELTGAVRRALGVRPA